MKVKFKKLNKEAVLPSYAKPGDAGMDLTTVSDGKLVQETVETEEGEKTFYYIEYDTGLAVQIPEDHVGLLFPRSSVSKTSLILANSVGVIDSGYRGAIGFRFKLDGISFLNKCGPTKLSDERVKGLTIYKKGDKIGQLMILPYPVIEVVEAKRLTNTTRGTGGFGSSGR